MQFSIFLVLKRLSKIKNKNKNHSKLPKLASQLLFKQFRQKSNIFFVVHGKFNPFHRVPSWAGANTDQPLNSNISETVRLNMSFTQSFLKSIQ